MKRITVSDIAKSLGVSKTLVSLVLNNKGNENSISPDTQKKVWEKAKELNYKPNRIAQGLRTGKSNILGLIVADIANPFYAKIARYIEDAADSFGYSLMICSSDENEEKEKKLLHMLKERQVDGLIISSTLSEHSEILQLKRENYPFVLIDRYFPRIDSNYVGVDNYEGACQAVEHLIQIGYRKIAHLTVSPSYITSLKDRSRGYRDSLKKHSIRYNKRIDREIDFKNLRKELQSVLTGLLSEPENVQALFVANNNLAVACLESLNEMNLMIPRDIAVVSFDDIELFAHTYSPITAVSQPVEDICSITVKTLLEDIKAGGKMPKQQHILSPNLIVRHSCGRLSGRINYQQ
ncbi:MAG: LacI family transcriptional regulator [Marinilabiliales bacterium]|nr:MAG: LacI family transcriptional regulator [Marinilabiliales bacterium]